MALKHFVKNLFSDTLVYGVSKAVTVLAGLVTIPILSRFLLVEEIGMFDFFNTIIVLISSLAFFGLDSTYGVIITGMSKIREDHQLESSIVVILLITVFASFTFMVLFQELIGIDMKELWSYFISVLPLNILVMFYSNKAKWKRDKGTYLFITIGRSILVLFGVLFLSYTGLLSFKSYLVLNVVFRLIILIFLMYTGFIELNTPSLRTISKLYRATSYLGLIAVLYALLPFLERFVVLNWLSSADLGRYTIILKCTSLLLIIATIFNTVWGPLSLQLKIDGNYLRKVFMITISYLYIYGVLLIGVKSDTILEFLVPGYNIEVPRFEIFLIGLNTAMLSVNSLIETDFLRIDRTATLLKIHLFTLGVGFVLSFNVVSLVDILVLYSIVYALRLVLNTVMLYNYDKVLYSSIVPIAVFIILLLSFENVLEHIVRVLTFLSIAFIINVGYVTINPKFTRR